MRTLKLYLETSVWNFYYADDAPEKKAITREFFQQALPTSGFDIYISEIVLDEIDGASQDKVTQLRQLVEQFQPKVLLWETAVTELAEAYLVNKVLSPKSLSDAHHVAFASVNHLDFVISWNLRHIANVHRQEKFKLVNRLNGYHKPISLITPLEVSHYE
jgi:hypothetical protein